MLVVVVVLLLVRVLLQGQLCLALPLLLLLREVLLLALLPWKHRLRLLHFDAAAWLLACGALLLLRCCLLQH